MCIKWRMTSWYSCAHCTGVHNKIYLVCPLKKSFVSIFSLLTPLSVYISYSISYLFSSFIFSPFSLTLSLSLSIGLILYIIIICLNIVSQCVSQWHIIQTVTVGVGLFQLITKFGNSLSVVLSFLSKLSIPRIYLSLIWHSWLHLLTLNFENGQVTHESYSLFISFAKYFLYTDFMKCCAVWECDGYSNYGKQKITIYSHYLFFYVSVSLVLSKHFHLNSFLSHIWYKR